MMDLSKPDQFDLDRLAEELGALPEAPLAMPAQTLEAPPAAGLLSLLRPRLGRVEKAGH
jgi:hypothetical protein